LEQSKLRNSIAHSHECIVDSNITMVPNSFTEHSITLLNCGSGRTASIIAAYCHAGFVFRLQRTASPAYRNLPDPGIDLATAQSRP
jgi:hypothetical protein